VSVCWESTHGLRRESREIERSGPPGGRGLESPFFGPLHRDPHSVSDGPSTLNIPPKKILYVSFKGAGKKKLMNNTKIHSVFPVCQMKLFQAYFFYSLVCNWWVGILLFSGKGPDSALISFQNNGASQTLAQPLVPSLRGASARVSLGMRTLDVSAGVLFST